MLYTSYLSKSAHAKDSHLKGSERSSVMILKVSTEFGAAY